MTQPIVLDSLAALATVRDRFSRDGRVPESMALVPVIGRSDPVAIDRLVEAAREALDELGALREANRERRCAAEADVQRWRKAAADLASVERLACSMRNAVAEATALAESAFDDGERAGAEAIAASMARLANEADADAVALRRDMDALAAREDVRRVLDEERRMEQEQAMRDQLAMAEQLLNAGRYEEARPLLTSLDKSISIESNLSAMHQTLLKRLEAVKARAASAALRDAEAALRRARSLYRREPVAALDLLEPLELDGLPDDLVRHLHGLWRTACRRLELIAAVHYRPGDRRWAVLIPSADGRYEVVTKLGLRSWSRGQTFAPRALRGARPL